LAPRTRKPKAPDPLIFEQCRSLGHEWRHKGRVTDTNRAPFGIEFGTIGLQSQCADCTTVRVKWITRSGEVHNRYDYPDGYQRRGEEKRTPQEWRHDFVARLFDEELTTNHATTNVA
jgi:hypothetical protein